MLALIIILTLLLSSTVVFADILSDNLVWIGTEAYNVERAWVWIGVAPVKPIPPIISVSSPVYNQTYSSKVSLNFTVTEPKEWFPISSLLKGIAWGELTSVYYVVDGGQRQYITMTNANIEPSQTMAINSTTSIAIAITISTTLNLTIGEHSVKIGVEAISNYVSSTPEYANPAVQANSEIINFAVTLPQPIIIASENIIYNGSNVPLTFNVDTSDASWVGYSLDGGSNVTISGNTTLTGLSNGEHYVTLYTNNSFGNLVASQPVNFTVALPPETKPFPTAPVAAASVVVAAACVGIILYFKKRKG